MLSKSKAASLLGLALTLAFFSVWYLVMIRQIGGAAPSMRPFQLFRWIFLLAPLLIVPKIWEFIKVAAIGDVLTFDRTTDRVLRNGTILSPLSQIDYVQIRTFPDPEGSHYHRVSVLLKDGTKIEIHQSSDQELISSLAENIADYAGVQVVKK